MSARSGWALLALALLAPAARAQLDQSCVVGVLNRTVPVRPDGSWVLPNVPANIGRVRARATCVADGVTRSGQSGFFVIPPNRVVEVPDIVFDAPAPIPAALALSSSTPTLTVAGATAQLALVATYPGGATANVTAAASGTTYTVSNSAIATVSADGLVTAVSSGTVLLTALHDGANALLRLSVVLSGDSDGDGIPDDVELANGLDPRDPLDALEDFDRDGLTNRRELELGTGVRDPDSDDDTLPDGREVQIGTDPLLFDTDGDGLGDGLEVATGSDPLDPTSYNLALALQSLDVRPASVTLVVNTVLGEASRRLTVTGHLIDGRDLDLTARARGTSYASSNLLVANFGAVDGEVFAGQDGAATVTVSNSGFTAGVPVTVRSFAPRALSSLAIAGARRVDVAGPYAYVAAGNAGLVVVDVADRAHPAVLATLDTPGFANDVKVVGARAYVADGNAGLRVVDVSDPAHPASLGAVDTPGNAVAVAVRGSVAYVADNSSLELIDVSDPALPLRVSSVAGASVGVSVDLGLAVVATGTGLRVIDVSQPPAPVVRGTLVTGNARGTITTVAGTGTAGYSGDGGPGTLAQLSFPVGLALTFDGSLLIADAGNNVVRQLAADGTLTTFAGTGTAGYSGDGGQATAAELNFPVSVAQGPYGQVYIADDGNNAVRIVYWGGWISTYAGNGTPGYGGDGGWVGDALLDDPAAIAFDAAGSLYIADTGNHRIRRVDTNGTITTVAGDGTAGYGGDGGPPTSAQLNAPWSVATRPDLAESVWIADYENHRVRRVDVATGLLSGNVFVTTLDGSPGPAWQAVPSAPWLSVSPSSGFGPSDVWITADTAGFACYDYTSATVTFTAAGTLDPRVVTVNVQVGQPELHAGAAAGATPKR